MVSSSSVGAMYVRRLHSEREEGGWGSESENGPGDHDFERGKCPPSPDDENPNSPLDRNEVHLAVTGLRNKENTARARDVNLMQWNGQYNNS